MDHVSMLNIEGRKIRLLIADDHALNRMFLKHQLTLFGVRAEEAADGSEALLKYQTNLFDLIITDCNMPVMDGYELTRRVREIERQSGLLRMPIIAWTDSSLEDEMARCRLAGMDDLFYKPTELLDLKAMLVKWVRNINT